MVKRNKMFLLFALVGATLVGCGSVNSSPFVESATDLLSNDKGIRFAADAESFVGSDEVVAYSPTYSQYGTNPETGNKVLRFATAVKGAIESISYTRAPVAGEENPHVKAVYSLYTGIMAGDAVNYYTSAGLSESEEDKGQYYWACYSIEYRDTTKFSVDVDVTFSINGEVVNTKQANLQNMIDVDTKLYKSIYIDGDVRVQHGQNINTAELAVKAINHDGTEITLDPADYSITNSKVARFGEAATVEIVHNQDSSLTASKEVITTRRVEGESGTIVGGKTINEAEYTLVNGSLVAVSTIGGAGGFSATVNGGKEGSLTLKYISKTAHTGGLTMKISNSNLAGESGAYYMKDLQLNSIVDISVNGTNISIADDVIVEGTPNGFTLPSYNKLYALYSLISFDNISFNAGVNTLKFNFKKSTKGETNAWKESPSEFNIDYVDFYSVGSETDMDVEAGLTLDETSFTAPAYGTKISALTESSLRAVGTTKSGNKVVFERDELNVTLSGGNHGYMEGTEEYIVFGDQTLSFNLVENEELSGTYTFNVKEYKDFNVQFASLRYSNNRVYYVLEGTSHGHYDSSEFVLFDGSKVIEAEWVFGLNTFDAIVDVTDYTVGTGAAGATAFFPHLKINGVMYKNTTNGDVNGLKTINAQIIYHNNVRYQLKEYYGMPIVSVGKLAYGSNTKDAVVTDVSLVKENSKVYYQLTGYCYNIATSKIVLNEISSNRTDTYDAATNKFVIRFDVTSRSAGTVYPHLTIDGVAYKTNDAGDLKGFGVTVNGKFYDQLDVSSSTAKTAVTIDSKYSIIIKWQMPTLKIA